MIICRISSKIINLVLKFKDVIFIKPTHSILKTQLKMKSNIESKKIRIYGAGGHSKVISEVLEENGRQVVCAFEDKPKIKFKALEGVITSKENNSNKFSNSGEPVIIGIGKNTSRAKVANSLACDYGKVFHKTSYIAKSVKIGKGTVVFAGAIIQPNAVVGDHVIINTAASIDHDCVIGDFVHISPKATLCGQVEIGEGSHIGAGAVIIQTIKVGKWCTVGAGAVILKDIPDFSTVVGNPGRIIKTDASEDIKKLTNNLLYDTPLELNM